ncbi:MAG TPA: NAD-dependent epimerase/dehydratase family protein [Aequorivita sp.]|nr:NAD-dependent epimerase/dehydratase family protein [Aequorivita sp.]
MKILVTGAGGFIGFHVVNALCELGHDVVGLDNINNYYDVNLKYARLAESGINRNQVENNSIVDSVKYDNYRFVKADIVDLKFLEELFNIERFEKVVHLAAQAGVRYSIENPHVYIQSNIVGFVNILECCRHYNVHHLVYASSSSVYGTNEKVPFSEEDRVDYPISLYAATKKSNELMAYTYSHLYQLPTTGLRFFTVYGPWGRPDMAPMLFANAIIKGEPIKVFNNGNMERDFTYIEDVVNGVLMVVGAPFSALKKVDYELYNLGCSNPIFLLDFISELEEELGIDANKIFIPMQPGDVKKTYASTSRFNLAYGYFARTNIHDGVREFTRWFKQYMNNQ